MLPSPFIPDGFSALALLLVGVGGIGIGLDAVVTLCRIRKGIFFEGFWRLFWLGWIAVMIASVMPINGKPQTTVGGLMLTIIVIAVLCIPLTPHGPSTFRWIHYRRTRAS